MNTQNFPVRFTAVERKILEQKAAALGITKADLLRRALLAYGTTDKVVRY